MTFDIGECRMSQLEFERQLVRLPADVKQFIREQAARNCSSQNSEIVRAVRARMEAEQERAVR
ncbi:Arc family DNA-binding protein [Bradyrhizobium niftali]